MKRGLLLFTFFLTITGCAPSTQDEPVHVQPVAAEANQEPNGSTIMNDPKQLHAGDKVGAMTVVSVTDQIEGYHGKGLVSIQFSGEVEITGHYKYFGPSEYFTDKITFRPDAASSQLIPKLMVDNRIVEPFFILQASDSDKERFGPVESEGKARIVISNYRKQYAPAEIFDTAKLVEVKEIRTFK